MDRVTDSPPGSYRPPPSPPLRCSLHLRTGTHVALELTEMNAPAPHPASLLRKLEWRVRHTADSLLGGEYRSAFRGRGREFDQVVQYEFGDDVRDIDWNVTARLGEPYRKKFVEERELTVVLLFDDSLSLQFGSGQRSKRDTLLELAGLLRAALAPATATAPASGTRRPRPHLVREPVRGRTAIIETAAAPARRSRCPTLDARRRGRRSTGSASSTPSRATASCCGSATSRRAPMPPRLGGAAPPLPDDRPAGRGLRGSACCRRTARMTAVDPAHRRAAAVRSAARRASRAPPRAVGARARRLLASSSSPRRSTA